MRTLTLLCAPICLFSFSLGVAATTGDEQEVSLVDLPGKVVAAIKAKFPAAKLVSAIKVTDDDETGYEVKITVKGPDIRLVSGRRFRSKVEIVPGKEQEIEIGLTADGAVYEMEKTIDAKDLPQPVQNVLKKDYATATVTKVEEVFKKDKLEYYEIRLTSNEKKKFEIEVTASGKVLVEEAEKTKKRPALDKRN